MTLHQAREHYGNYAKMARALGISRSAITQWQGVIPDQRQLDLQRITKGALQADSAILSRLRAVLRAA